MKSLVYVALGWVLPIVVFLLATPVLVAHFGLAGFGVFALAGTLVTAGASLDFGIGTLAVRELARRRGDPAACHRQACALNTVFAGLALGAVALAWTFAGPIARALNWPQALPAGEALDAARWAGLWLGLALVNAGLASGLRAMERFDLIALLGTVAAVATWGLAALAAKWQWRPADAVGLAAGVAAVQMVFASAAQARVFGRWPRLGALPRFEPGSARFAGSAFLSQATSMATYHADKAIVSALLGTAPAGMYLAAANIANKPLGFIATLAGILFPRIAHLESQGRSFSSARTYLAASRMLAAASTLILVCGLVLAEEFVGLWLGPAVAGNVTPTFRILLVAYWLAAMSVAPSNTLAGQGNTHRGAVFSIVGAVLTLAGCVLLVPRFGLVGAAWAGLLGMSQALVFELWAHHGAQARHRFTRFRMRRTAAVLALCSAAAAAATALVSSVLGTGWLPLLAAGLVGTVAFAALWFGSGLAVREERVLLARMLRLFRRKGSG